MDKIMCFVAVEFPDDPNVAGLTYWYLCSFDIVQVGDCVVAPLGRHNGLQNGMVRKVIHATEHEAPYPVKFIKKVKEIIQ